MIAELGRTPSATARAAGVARSTLHRISTGKTSPSLETLRELALVAGLDLEVTLVPASDPAAAVAARVIADPAMPEIDDWKEAYEADAVIEWVARLRRLVDGDHKRLLQRAGDYSAPQHRKGARFFAPKPGLTQERVTEVANSAIGRLDGALSGVAASKVYLGYATDPGPVVVWAREVDKVAERMGATLKEVPEYQPAGVLVAPTVPAYFVDMLQPPTWDQRVVSPIQAAIDLYGLGYDRLADEITEDW